MEGLALHTNIHRLQRVQSLSGRNSLSLWLRSLLLTAKSHLAELLGHAAHIGRRVACCRWLVASCSAICWLSIRRLLHRDLGALVSIAWLLVARLWLLLGVSISSCWSSAVAWGGGLRSCCSRVCARTKLECLSRVCTLLLASWLWCRRSLIVSLLRAIIMLSVLGVLCLILVALRRVALWVCHAGR